LTALSAPVPGEQVRLRDLFMVFLKVSLLAFGGGLVWARRAVVDQRHWMSDEEFADTLSLCQFMPGPNVIGIAVCVGAKLRGGMGTLSAIAGFVVIPWAIGFGLGVLYLQHSDIPLLQAVLRGVSAVAAGLLIATGLRLLFWPRIRASAVLFAALAFVGMAFTKLPLLVVLFGLAPLSIAFAALAGARAR
jgi:chromate transporter